MYVQRDASGKIIAIFSNAQDYTTEKIVDTDPAIVAFINSQKIDGNGFAEAIKISVGGILSANALMGAYPAFFPAIQSANWTDVQTLVLDAKSKAVITAAQYKSIKAAAQQFNIPVTLP